MNRIAIVVITYNRVHSLKRLLSSLSRANYSNDKVDLIISCDYSGNNDVSLAADNYSWLYGDKVVVKHEHRLGLKDHVFYCLSFAEKYDYIFVLEDDLIVSDSFFLYGKEATAFYRDNENIAAISLYSYQKNWLNWAIRFEPQKSAFDTYFMRLGQSWGEVFSKKQWLSFKRWLSENLDFVPDNNNPSAINEWPKSSWLKYFIKYCIEMNKFLVYPYHGFSSNCSDLGEHNSGIPVNDYQVDLVERQSSFRFPLFVFDDYNCVKYDEYMNRIGLEKFLELPTDKFCSDLWGTKNILLADKEYYLTSSKIKRFKPIQSFALSLRPIEMNIETLSYGNDIFLYKIDKKINRLYFRRRKNKKLILYSFRTNDLKTVLVLKNYLLIILLKRIIKKIFKGTTKR